MKKQYGYWIAAAAVVIIGAAVGLILWKGKSPRTGEKVETPIAEEAPAPKIVLRELQPVKVDEEKFLEAVRQIAGAGFDSLAETQQLSTLLRLADDSEATNRLLAVQKLGEIETTDNRRVDKLIAKLNDENPWVVEAAVLALAKLRAPEAAAPLQQLLATLQQPKAAYTPFANTALLAAHGRVQTNNGRNEFAFQLAAFGKSESEASAELSDREKMALFILPGFETCLALPNFKVNWEKLQNSEFARQLVQLQAWQDFKAAAPFNRLFNLQEKLDAELGPLGGNMNYLIDPLGDEVYLATYAGAEGKRTLLVTPANMKARAFNTTLKALGKVRSGDLTITKQTYRSESLFHITADKRGTLFRYAVVDDYLVMTDDEQLLPAAITAYKDKDESSLAYQTAFRQSLPALDPSSFALIFVDPQKFFHLDKGQQVTETLTATVAKALYEITSEAVALPPEVPPAPASAAPPVAAQALQFIPANAIFCYATTAINPQPLWQYVTTKRAEKDAIKGFETRSNLNLGRDLISKLDQQLFYFVAGIDTGGPRFFWRQLAGVRLREPQGVEKYCTKLLNFLYSPKDDMQIEDYAGVKIHYVQSPTPFEPNFAVVDNYLLMAFDRATLRAAIDAGQKRSDALEQNAGFAAVRHRLQADENALVYFNAENFLDNYRSYLLAYDRVTNLFDQSDVQTRLDPLFALVKANVQVGAGKVSAAGNGEMVFGMK